MRIGMRLVIATAVVVGYLATTARAVAAVPGEIGFAEEFALAEDRAAALEKLIPGTEDFYFYSALHRQNRGDFDGVQKVLDEWIPKMGQTARVKEIIRRQALLTYPLDPKRSLEYLARELGLSFSHQRQVPGEEPRLPTRFDESQITRDALLKRALTWHNGHLTGLEPSALDWLTSEARLTADQRREFLRRLTRPDHDKLPGMIVDDLNAPNSGGWNSHTIHSLLTLAQLDECASLKPDLMQNQNFVTSYMERLRPPGAGGLDLTDTEIHAWLERLERFVLRLGLPFEALKAEVLFKRLSFDMARGEYDRGRFTDYLKLPRQVGYMRHDYLNRRELRGYGFSPSPRFAQWTGPAEPEYNAANDEKLVRAHFERFFLTDNDTKAWEPYIEEQYLREMFAEVKITRGTGDADRWFSSMRPWRLQELRERIDLEFTPERRERFAPDEKVSLDIYTKNIETLIVKVYRINALNYYRENGHEVTTDVSLDGLVANRESIEEYKETPFRRVRRTFEFPELSGPGVYVVEFVGGGKSSRAVVRKGQLTFTTRIGSAGHEFLVRDEANAPVKDATLWLDSHRYDADANGVITVPFSTNPGGRAAVLSRGELASLARFAHQSEDYELQAGFFADREQLLSGRTAKVLVRPALRVNGHPAPLSLIEEATLAIVGVDRDGTDSRSEVRGFELHADRETVHEFQVPDRMRSIRFELSGKVQNLSKGRRDELIAAETIQTNLIDVTAQTDDVFLRRSGDVYALEVLGRNGEPRAARQVSISLKHEDFTDQISASLQTDASGRITLGELRDIVTVQAGRSSLQGHQWSLRDDFHSRPPRLHALAGETVRLPWMESDPAHRTNVSLLELRQAAGNSAFTVDHFGLLRVRGGFLEIDDLPEGVHNLRLKREETEIEIEVLAGGNEDGHILTARRKLELPPSAPLQITELTARQGGLTVRLEGAHDETRVHVVAARFMPEVDPVAAFGSVRFPGPWSHFANAPRTQHLSAREIGDEYRYILERRYAKKYPGVMLDRPGLLLNPWAHRKTEASEAGLAAGGAYDALASPQASMGALAEGKVARMNQESSGFTSFDFLRSLSLVAANLRPDADGVVRVDLSPATDRPHVHVIAVSGGDLIWREVFLEDAPASVRDLRLTRPMDADTHASERRLATIARPGEDFVIEDLSSSSVELYDTVAKVWRFFKTVSNDPTLAEFEFVTRWPSLTPEQKREKYSKYACHELNLFLRFKDPEFFDAVAKPFLANKKEKQFMDRWLLGEDVSRWLEPARHAELNIAERALLASVVNDEAEHTRLHINDLYNLLPPDADEFADLHEKALRVGALGVGGIVLGGEFDLDGAAFADASAADELVSLRRDRSAERGALGMVSASRNEAFLAKEEVRQMPAAPPSAAAPMEEAEMSADAFRADDRAGAMKAKKDSPKRQVAASSMLRDAREGDELGRRSQVRQFYRKTEKTEELVENHYYHLPIEQQTAELITVNRFWLALAEAGGRGPILDPDFIFAARSFPEMMFALALVDLPFEAGKHDITYQGATMTLRAAHPLIAIHKEILPVPADPEPPAVLISQDLFRSDDRYHYENNERSDKFVTDEFLTHVVYGAQVVVTNATSARRKLDVLTQIPGGAIAVSNSRATGGRRLDLQPWTTERLEYFFYFPAPGEFAHYPVQVALDEMMIAHGEPRTLRVVERPETVDETSWEYISQMADDETVFRYLTEKNPKRVDLSRIAWRMRDAGFFGRAIDVLGRRHAFDATLWSYGFHHDAPVVVGQYLLSRPDYLAGCGRWLESELVTIDPTERRWYQQMEYEPLINERIHKLGARRRILNDRFHAQYHAFMDVLTYRPSLSSDEMLGVTYYMLLQDRFEEAIAWFGRAGSAGSRLTLQYDAMDAHLAMVRAETDRARAIAARYSEYPVDRWRKHFAGVSDHLDQIARETAGPDSSADRRRQQDALASTEAGFDIKVEAGQVEIRYANLDRVTVSYYPMDVELLFSRNPFVKGFSGQFSFIQPNVSHEIELSPESALHTFPLPDDLIRTNVMVEVRGAGVSRSSAWFANTMGVQMIENYGQVRVTDAASGKPLPGIYIKAYARMSGGEIRFYKDGYTDLRGRFDYASLNSDELERVERFSVLVLSDDKGAAVEEAAPPSQ